MQTYLALTSVKFKILVLMPASFQQRTQYCTFAYRASEPTVFSAYGVGGLSQAIMWMLVAVTILSDCFYWWLVAEERYRLSPQPQNLIYRLHSSA